MSSPTVTNETVTYEKDGRIARLTLNRPERGNGIIPELVAELAAGVERANVDPEIHVIALSGNGKGFCGGYDLVATAEKGMKPDPGSRPDPGSKPEVDRDSPVSGAPNTSGASVTDWAVQAANHDPSQVWDPMVDYAWMRRNVRGFMSLYHSDKPTVCKVHGFCVAGGTDMALCSDLLVIEDTAKIGYPPARVWGVPTTALWAQRIGIERAKRLLFTGDCLSGKEAAEWGLATEAPTADQLDERFEILLGRIARMPVNQLMMMKLLIHQTVPSQGLDASQTLGVVFDGIARHTKEGYAFQQRAAEAGFKQAVRERDEPFGDFGPSTFKG